MLVSAAASRKEPFSFLISRHPVRLFADAHMFGASHLCLWKKGGRGLNPGGSDHQAILVECRSGTGSAGSSVTSAHRRKSTIT